MLISIFNPSLVKVDWERYGEGLFAKFFAPLFLKVDK